MDDLLGLSHECGCVCWTFLATELRATATGSWALAVEPVKRSQGPWHTIATANPKPFAPRASAAPPYPRTEGFLGKAPGPVDDTGIYSWSRYWVCLVDPFHDANRTHLSFPFDNCTFYSLHLSVFYSKIPRPQSLGELGSVFVLLHCILWLLEKVRILRKKIVFL